MSAEMEYRRLGRTELQVSAVGFGTSHFQAIPRQQAIETLLRGFDLGVNLVHTAPDYGSAEEFIEAALERTDRHVIVAAHGFDVPQEPPRPVKQFSEQFERSFRRFGRRGRLDLFGIASVEDREAYGENVWGKDGMVEFLLRMKEQGRLGGMFCTTHGSPEYVERILHAGVFDAVMLAYNQLGFHLLSTKTTPERPFENLPRTGEEILPLCQRLDVGVMVMEPLGGGLLCRSLAFPTEGQPVGQHSRVTAEQILRSLLEDRRLACVVPGTAHPAEAEENARSGHRKTETKSSGVLNLIDEVRRTVCSRCGLCESSCSQGLPVAMLMRSALMSRSPSARYELYKPSDYFEVHPRAEMECTRCTAVTCHCPAGIDIPTELQALHGAMRRLRKEGVIPPPMTEQERVFGSPEFAAQVLSWDIPAEMAPGETACGSIYLENAGERGWYLPGSPYDAEVMLAVFLDRRRVATVKLPTEVQPDCRCRFVFEMMAPRKPAATEMAVRLQLLGEHEGFSAKQGIELFAGLIELRSDARDAGLPRVRKNAAMFKALLAQAMQLYCCEWLSVQAPAVASPGATVPLRLHLANRGIRRWRADEASGRPVQLVVRVDGTQQPAIHLPHDVPRGHKVKLCFDLRLPSSRVQQSCRVELALVEHNVAWFEQHGVKPLVLDIRLEGPPAHDVEWLGHNLPQTWPSGADYQVNLSVRNTGRRAWRASGATPVDLALFLDGQLHTMVRVPSDVAPGEKAMLCFRLTLPDQVGERALRLTFVEQNVAWFDEVGAQPLIAAVRVERRDIQRT